jgi:sporulation integral membrane protein YtvI
MKNMKLAGRLPAAMENPTVQKRLATLINVAYYALIIAVFYLIFKTFFGMLVPFIVAFIFAALFQKPVNFLARKTPVKRSVSSTVCVLLVVGVIALLFSFLGMGVADKIKSFYDYVMARMQNIPELLTDIKVWLLDLIGHLPGAISERLSGNITEFFDDIIKNGFGNFSINSIGLDWSSLISKGGGFLKNTVSSIPSVAIGCVVSIIACAFMTADYDRIRDFLLRQLSDHNSKRLTDGYRLATSTLKKMLKAYSLIILITTCELMLGFYILKMIGIFDSTYIPLIAFVIALIDIIPVLGTGTVLIPWAVYSFITGHIPMGIGLLIIYVVILVIRQILEPRLVAGQVGLPPIVTIIAMYIGTKTLGVLGFFILPFCVILIKELNEHDVIHLFKHATADSAAEATGETEGPADPDDQNEADAEPNDAGRKS